MCDKAITITTKDLKALRHVAKTLRSLANTKKKDAGLRKLYPALATQIESLQERVENALLDGSIPLWEMEEGER